MSAGIAVAVYTACAAADLGTTAVAQHRGAVERYDWLADTQGRTRWGRAVPMKVASMAAAALVDHQIEKKSKKLAWGWRAAVVAVHIWVASHNLSAKERR